MLLTVLVIFGLLYLALIGHAYRKQPVVLHPAIRTIRATSSAMGSMLGVLVIIMVFWQCLVVIFGNFYADTSLGPHLVAMQESVTWMFGTIFMLGAVYTLYHDEHVRVDVLYRLLPPRGQAIINILGTVILLIPTMCIILYVSWGYVAASWSQHEASNHDLPGLYILKSLLLVMCVQMLLQALVIITENIMVLGKRIPHTLPPEHPVEGL